MRLPGPHRVNVVTMCTPRRRGQSRGQSARVAEQRSKPDEWHPVRRDDSGVVVYCATARCGLTSRRLVGGRINCPTLMEIQ